jgi:tetratricopeptide (TPR) repeat protein
MAGVLAATPSPLSAQSASSEDAPQDVDKSSAYYHFALGHLYSELAGAYGKQGNFVDKAIDSYRKAMESDPDASFLSEELSDLYIQAGRLREAVLDAESALRDNPNDLNARRILARIYTRLLGDRSNQANEEMLTKAIEQYQKISELQPDKEKNWLMLGYLYKLNQQSPEAEEAYKKALAMNADSEDALVGLAQVYSDLGDQPRAAEMLRRVVGDNPSARTLAFLAQTYEAMKDYSLAAESYRQALQLSPRNAEVKRAYAQNLLMAGKSDDSLPIFEELAESDPRDFDSRLRLSQIYRGTGDLKKARKALDQAKEISPENLEIQYTDVNLLVTEGKSDEAIAELKEILASTQRISYSAGERANRSIFLERLGVMYRATEDYEQAVSTFKELGTLDPDASARMASQIADTYRQSREFDKALEEIEAAHQKYPDDEMVGTIRATVLADLGREADAIAAIKEISGDQPDREDYLTEAQIYEKTKRFDLMADAISKALELSESDDEKATVLFMQGAMYERQKMFDEAESSFREVLRISPDNSSAMNYLGYMFADKGIRLDEALELITKALEYDPENGAYLDSLGWAYYQLDRFEEAAVHLTRAAERVSNDPVVHDHLGDAHFKLGNLREAIANWKRSVQEWNTSPAGERDDEQVALIQTKLEGAEVRLAKEGSKQQQP